MKNENYSWHVLGKMNHFTEECTLYVVRCTCYTDTPYSYRGYSQILKFDVM